jgi:hypothetical protein
MTRVLIVAQQNANHAPSSAGIVTRTAVPRPLPLSTVS